LPIVEQGVVIYPYMEIDQSFSKPSDWKPEMLPMVNLQTAVTATNDNLNKMENPYY
jgi:hypothetical protein